MIERAVVSQVDFDVTRIVIDTRKRGLGDISSLAQSISELGLLHPIALLPNGTLVSGYRRLEACKSLGWQTVPVIIREWEELQTELAEIDESIIHNKLKGLERSRNILRRKDIYEALYPEMMHDRDRKSNGQDH